MGALNVIEPTLKPRATEHIGGMIKMIERLVDTGYAYVVDGHVLFDTTKYPQGVLTGQTEGRDHARIDEASYKRNQSDFVLWKPADGEVGWDSPWGAGRPGWHIECSAIHRTGVHDDGIGFGLFEPLRRETVERVIFARRGEVGAVHPFVLEAEHHHNVGARDPLVHVGEGRHVHPLHRGRDQGRRDRKSTRLNSSH